MPKTRPSHQQRQELVRLYRQALIEGVSLNKIEEKVDKLAERFTVADRQEISEVRDKEKHFRRAIPRAIRLGAAVLPTVLLLLGIGLVGSATWPIVVYYVGDFTANAVELKTPIPPEQVLETSSLALASASDGEEVEFGVPVEDEAGPIILNTALDYTDLSNWFTGDQAVGLSEQQESISYKIEIPKINIYDAQVLVGGTDLSRSLIAYPGTALPGQPGSPVIFGHSILRQFYNPSVNNPRRYTSIFSYIMTLEKGDKIYVTQDNVRYTYVVTSKTEVKPTDTYILSQNYDIRQLKLVTCVPEGTYLLRGVVTAQLVRE
ncbi:MAG: Sortase family protein [Candidatus Pacebacteria bacterium GW2011_GWB1_47_8]|nr:MAG: Sortase family protein [Candidatus Pacebacteria bacterium GW2011_GWA1_46_10]KKU84107.1 MAG: Sortase family protein [Candidatus Pacebacteria bacterium GW2011_GWB1_47_8]HCR81525.1 hypothetical protein [Candidatus Paceibacterota bacterium]